MKRFLSIFLTFLMICTMLPMSAVSAFAEEIESLYINTKNIKKIANSVSNNVNYENIITQNYATIEMNNSGSVKEFNGHTYQVYDIDMTWTEAKEYCQSIGGHLVTITSQEEQGFVEGLLNATNKEGCWLGGALNNGSYKWITNETMNYTNWQNGEPNNYLGRDENYITMLSSTMKWYDFPNNGDPTGTTIDKMIFICEWDISTQICLTSIKCNEFTRYTGNVGDSNFSALDRSYTLNDSCPFYGYTNIGVDGKTYDNGFCVWIARWNYGDKISWTQAKFDLNSQYQTFRGNSTLLQSRNTNNFDTSVYFYNGDDLLYSFTMTPDNYDNAFSFDVTGVDELTVLVKDNTETAGGTSFALYDLYLTSNKDTDTDGMQIIVNNTNLSYYAGDYIYVAVCENKNNVKVLPEKLSVKVSDTSVVEVKGIYDYNNLPNQLKGIEEFRNYKIIALKAVAVGSAMISITNSKTGENRIIPISVCEDEVAELRADKVPLKTYKCGFETDRYNAYCEGIWISDFSCEKSSDNSSWNISMNLYNENYCCGVVEVYNASGKLIAVKDVGKFESLTKGIFKTFKAGYTIVEDLVQGDSFSFRSDATSKHTKIENLYVPQDGYIRVTADISASSVCAVNNGFDMIFTGISLADDVKGIIKGIDSLSEENMQQIKKTVFAKLLAQEEYLKFTEKFQEKMIKKAKENMLPDMINEFTRTGILDLDEMLNDMNWSLDGLLKTALGTGTGIAEGLFEKCAGPFGLVLKGMFLFQDVCDFIYEARDLGKRITGNAKFGCYTPVAGSKSGVIKNEYVTVDGNGNVPAETVLQSFRIINPDSTVVVLNQSFAYSEYQLYEIALYCNGVTIQPNGKVKVYIDCPYNKAIVAREEKDGTLKYIESKIENGMIVFEVDHFCKFTVINEESKVEDSLGDVNGDGIIDDWDGVVLDRYLAGWEVEINTSAADIDGNGIVDDWDGVLLARKLAGWN